MSGAPRAALAGVIVATLVAAAVALVLVDRASTLDDAVADLGDDSRFASSAKAGQTVADISHALRVDGTKCREQKRAPARCRALLSAAAFSAVTAVALLDCTAPAVYDARVALRQYLQKLRAYLDDGARGTVPTLPKVVTC